MNPYTPPQFEHSSFNCPNCHAFAAQEWLLCYTLHLVNTKPSQIKNGNQSLHAAKCSHCNNSSLWLSALDKDYETFQVRPQNPTMIYPSKTNVVLPNQDLSEDIKDIYNEAASIIDLSPRGAAALLRLALEMLLIELGGDGKNIKTDIQKLLKGGLDTKLEQALEFVRVIGNHAVHPNSINLNDKREFAIALFNIINFITEELISKEKRINSLYGQLPEDELKKIEASNNPIRQQQDS